MGFLEGAAWGETRVLGRLCLMALGNQTEDQRSSGTARACGSSECASQPRASAHFIPCAALVSITGYIENYTASLLSTVERS